MAGWDSVGGQTASSHSRNLFGTACINVGKLAGPAKSCAAECEHEARKTHPQNHREEKSSVVCHDNKHQQIGNWAEEKRGAGRQLHVKKKHRSRKISMYLQSTPRREKSRASVQSILCLQISKKSKAGFRIVQASIPMNTGLEGRHNTKGCTITHFCDCRNQLEKNGNAFTSCIGNCGEESTHSTLFKQSRVENNKGFMAIEVHVAELYTWSFLESSLNGVDTVTACHAFQLERDAARR